TRWQRDWNTDMCSSGHDSNASGTITAADNAAFAVAINATTGVVSTVQYVSLHHGSPDTPTDISEAVNLGNTINAVVTVTDGDGEDGRAAGRERWDVWVD